MTLSTPNNSVSDSIMQNDYGGEIVRVEDKNGCGINDFIRMNRLKLMYSININRHLNGGDFE